MQIKSRLNIVIILMFLLIVIVGFTILRVKKETTRVNIESELSYALTTQAHSLNHIVQEYRIFQEKRMADQAAQAYDSTMRLLEEARRVFRAPEKLAVVEKIAVELEYIQQIIQRLSKMESKRRPVDSVRLSRTADGTDSIESRLSSQILLKSYNIELETMKLLKLAKHEIIEVQRKTYSVILLSLILISAAITMIILFIKNSIVGPLLSLHTGTEIIGAGDLNYRVGIDAKNEVGQLSRAIDSMTDNLQQITASREELLKEVEERKRVEGGLKESENKYRLLTESLTELIYRSDPETFVASYVNSAVEQIYGYSVDEWLGDPALWEKSLYPDDRENVYSVMETARSDNSNQSLEYRIIRKDGKIRWVLDQLSWVSDNDGKIVSLNGMVSDITERKEAEEALRESTETLRVITSSAQSAIMMVDDEGKVVFWNEAAERIFGYRSDEAIGVHMATLIVPERFREDHTEGFARFCITGKSKIIGKTVELPAIRKDGSEFEASHSISCVNLKGRWHAIAIINNITERKEDEERLKKSEAGLVEAQRIARLGSWNWDIINDSLSWSEGIYRIFGLDPQEFDDTYEAFINSIHPDDRESVKEAVGRALDEHEPYSIVHRIVTPDSVEKIVQEQGEVYFDESDRPVRMVGTVQDITEYTHSKEKVARQVKQLEGLRSIDTAINASLDMHLTLDVVLSTVIKLLNVDAADILIYQPHLQTLNYAHGLGFRTTALKHTNLKLSEGYASKAVLEEKMVYIQDLSKGGDAFKVSKHMDEEEFVSYYCFPLIAKGNVKGVLEILNRSAINPDKEWLDFFETLAGQTAIAIDNAMLYDDLKHSNIELLRAYDTTLEGWSKALDMRDKETEGHSQRVTAMTLTIARALKIDEEELANLRRGALLHDIGKIGIPDKILLKPGPLDEDEWDIMRKHPVLAYEMLSPIEFLRSSIDIPYCHHEKWDGTGYPRGLKGEEIPLGARIFAAVDIFDALSSDRPYRPAWEREKVLEHLRSISGTHLDSNVVEAFFRNFDKSDKELNIYND